MAGAALSMSCVRMRVASRLWCASRIVVSVISTPAREGTQEGEAWGRCGVRRLVQFCGKHAATLAPPPPSPAQPRPAPALPARARTARLAVLAHRLGPGLGPLPLQVVAPAGGHDVRVGAVRQRHGRRRDLGGRRADGAGVLGPIHLLLGQVLQQAAQLAQLLRWVGWVGGWASGVGFGEG